MEASERWSNLRRKQETNQAFTLRIRFSQEEGLDIVFWTLVFFIVYSLLPGSVLLLLEVKNGLSIPVVFISPAAWANTKKILSFTQLPQRAVGKPFSTSRPASNPGTWCVALDSDDTGNWCWVSMATLLPIKEKSIDMKTFDTVEVHTQLLPILFMCSREMTSQGSGNCVQTSGLPEVSDFTFQAPAFPFP